MGFINIAIALSALQLTSAQRDYCTIASCNGKTHVGCPIPDIPEGPTCSSFTAITYSDSQINQFVALHNEKRNIVASGQAVSTPKDGSGELYLPSATDIKTLSWDSELALLASYNVRQCKMAHDSCRNTDQRVGQNLYRTWSTDSNVSMDTVMEKAINAWYKEIDDFDVPQIDHFTGANGVGHFTQVIWADTTKVGCAGAKFTNEEMKTSPKIVVKILQRLAAPIPNSPMEEASSTYFILVACNYAVAGNIHDEKIYTSGEAGSTCATKDSIYTSLCAT